MSRCRLILPLSALAVSFMFGCSGGSGSSTSTQNPTTTTTTSTAPLVTQAAAARFLEQSTFGPTTTLIAQVQQTGFPPFLNSQFAAPISTYADPASTVTSIQSTHRCFLPMP